MSHHDPYLEFEDYDLWVAMQNGERQALNEIYRRYIDILYAYGNKISPDHTLVEDCIQEVFITLWTKREKLKATDSIQFYLFKALKRRIYRLQKNKGRQGNPYDFSDPSFSGMLKCEPGTEKLEEATLQRINRSLEKLTERQKEIVFLRFYAHLEISEIAGVMGLTSKATYKLLYRAIARLRAHFEKFPENFQK